MFVNRIYPAKSLKTSFVSPGKSWNLSLQVLESPGKPFFTVGTNPNHRSGTTPAMLHRLKWFVHLQAQGRGQGDEHPAYISLGHGCRESQCKGSSVLLLTCLAVDRE